MHGTINAKLTANATVFFDSAFLSSESRTISRMNYKFTKVSTTTIRTIKILMLRRQRLPSYSTDRKHLYISRVLTNFPEVQQSLLDYANDFMHNTKVTLQFYFLDLSELSLSEQVALIYYDVDILIGFHGAGMNHMFHMDRSRGSCCGVIELFPQKLGCTQENHDSKFLLLFFRINLTAVTS